jgi:hypothetical protein
MHGDNIARLPGVFPQGAAHQAQTGSENRLAHHRVGPHRVQQCRFGHHLPGLAHEQPEHGQGFGLSFSIAEHELQTLGSREMVGDYATWSYF